MPPWGGSEMFRFSICSFYIMCVCIRVCVCVFEMASTSRLLAFSPSQKSIGVGDKARLVKFVVVRELACFPPLVWLYLRRDDER